MIWNSSARFNVSGWRGMAPLGSLMCAPVVKFLIDFQPDAARWGWPHLQTWQPNHPTQCSNIFGGGMEVIWNSSAHFNVSGWRGTVFDVCWCPSFSSRFSGRHSGTERVRVGRTFKHGSPITLPCLKVRPTLTRSVPCLLYTSPSPRDA